MHSPFVFGQPTPTWAPFCPEFVMVHVMSLDHKLHILHMGMNDLDKVMWQEIGRVPVC